MGSTSSSRQISSLTSPNAGWGDNICLPSGQKHDHFLQWNCKLERRKASPSTAMLIYRFERMWEEGECARRVLRAAGLSTGQAEKKRVQWRDMCCFRSASGESGIPQSPEPLFTKGLEHKIRILCLKREEHSINSGKD